MSVYEGSVWAPHMGMNRISYSDQTMDALETQIRTQYPDLTSGGWHNGLKYTHY